MRSYLVIIGILFLVLKLIGVIHWSWFWVLSPFWILALIWIIFLGGLTWFIARFG